MGALSCMLPDHAFFGSDACPASRCSAVPGADLVEACAPRQENVAIVATQTLGGGAFSMKYMYERGLFDRVSDVGAAELFLE